MYVYLSKQFSRAAVGTQSELTNWRQGKKKKIFYSLYVVISVF